MSHPWQRTKGLKTIAFCLLALGVITGGLAFAHVFFISDGGDGTLLWNGDTAYLFLDIGSFGYRMTYLEYIGQTVRNIFGAGREPSDERYSNVVITMNSINVSRYVLDDIRLSQYLVIDGSVLSGDLKTGILWKWDHNHFERATAQDQNDLTKATSSHMPGPDYDDVDGWHKRCCFFTRKDNYTYVINLNGGTQSLKATREPGGDLSADIVRSDGTHNTIWHLDGHPRKVSKAKYAQEFGKH